MNNWTDDNLRELNRLNGRKEKIRYIELKQIDWATVPRVIKIDLIKKSIKREDNSIYVASWSGGKDSTFMVDQLLRNGDPLDLIVFSNTGYEFKEMYKYIETVKEFWEIRYGVEVVLLNAGEAGRKVWSKWAEGNFVRGQHVGKPRGFPFSIGMSWCTRELKINPFNKFIADRYPESIIKRYVGIAYDEQNRITVEDNILYPINEWKLSEKEVEDTLVEREMHNPLYNHFGRTGCYLCPKQNLKSLFKLWKYYPEEWKELEDLVHYYRKQGAAITQIRNHEIEELVEKFEKYQENDKEPENNREEDIEIGCFCK